MLSALISSPTLKIQLSEEMLYLSPSILPDIPSNDRIVAGTCTLYLPKARVIKSLKVVLNGRIDIGFPVNTRPYESSKTLEREVDLVENGEFEKGEHVFSFSIICPSNTAPYERNQYGRVRHFISARAKSDGVLNSTIASAEQVVFLIVGPDEAGQPIPPPALDLKVEGVSEDFGCYTLRFESKHLTVAGLLLFRFNFISPPSQLRILSIKLKIFQTIVLTSQIDGSVVRLDPDPRTVFRLDQNTQPNEGTMTTGSNNSRGVSGSRTPVLIPLRVLDTEESWKFMHLARLMDDNSLRSSTQPGTLTGIEITHQISVEVNYQVGSFEEIKKLEVTKPLNLHSCCCVTDSLVLPLYSQIDPFPSPDFSPPCICSMKLAELIKSQGDTLGREEGEEGISYQNIGSKNDSGTTTPTNGGNLAPGRGRGIFRAISADER